MSSNVSNICRVDQSQQDVNKCPDCNFVSRSQGGLAVHRSKCKNVVILQNVDCVYVERSFPEGKPIVCCLCDVSIGSIANFRRHFKSKHKKVKLMESARCSLCNDFLKDGRGAGVHLKRFHQIGSKDDYPISPTPIISSTNKPTISVHRKKNISKIKSLSKSPARFTTLNPNPFTTFLLLPFIHEPFTSHPPPNFTQTRDESNSYSPPRPSSPVVFTHSPDPSTTPFTHNPSPNPGVSQPRHNNQIWLEAEVVLSDCTNVDSYVPSQQDDLESEVAFSGRTNENSDSPSQHANFDPSVSLSGRNDGNSNTNTTESVHSSSEQASSNTSEFVRKWSNRISTTESFDDFCHKCDDYANAVVLEVKSSGANNSNRCGRPVRNARNRPNSRLPNPNRRPLISNPIQAGRIQTLFRLSNKRAARKILQDNNITYTGTKDQAQEYFTDTFSTSTVDLNELVSSLSDNVPSTDIDQSLMDQMSPKEIKDKLKSMSNSAPGKDKVEYRHLKLVDPDCKVLSLIYNKCLEEKKIPSSWKQSSTILIYKKGSSDDPSNFRPIALMLCIYKLFTSILAARISNFAINKDLISNEQKSAKPSEGCHEHSYTLQSVVADCKRNYKNCFLAWLDLRNAFGSISHDAIYSTLSHMGFPESLINLIKDIYTDSSMVVRTGKDEETDSIPIRAGVKQGCPVSPVLFNLSTELLVRVVKSRCNESQYIPFQLHGQPVYVLAYADDLVLMSRTRDGLQSLLDDVSLAANILNLKFRPDKCASLSLTCNKHEPSRVGDTTFKVQDGVIPALLKEESYRYLGVPIGLLYDAKDMNTITEKLIADLEKIRDSLLTPWQKLDAIRTFIQPGLTYALRTCPVTCKALEKYRKKTGLQDPFNERHIQSVVHAVKILSVSDPFVSNIAKNELKSVVSRCLKREAENDEVDQFLSGNLDGNFSNHMSCGNGQTLWSCCCISACALKVKVKSASENILISVDNFQTATNSKGVASYLHRSMLKRAFKLKSLPDQGKVARCLQSTKFPSTNSWCYDGTGIRFCDWRFIHRARTNTLPTNAVKSRFANGNTKECRRCHSNNDSETLPHIICHCHPNMNTITARHNKILERLSTVIQSGTYSIDQIVPDAPGNNRPDLVITDGNKVTIIDVTCPFENDEDALRLAAERKEIKYNYLVDHFNKSNKQAKVFGFVVGPLGAWYPGNEKVLDELNVSLRYRTLFRKLCCADSIKISRNIYVEHLT
ncbi:Hypothetical predicted protein, partial [Paramuricea clavata]